MAVMLSDAERWDAVRRRDPQYAGVFVYGVRSTRIYCRAGCPARQPRRRNVEFFPVPAAAEQAGYRACRRCAPRDAVRRDPQAELVERACRLLGAATADRIPLATLARRLGASPSHLQRVFKRFTGVSPRAYDEALRQNRLRGALREGGSVSRAIYDAGYGSSRRVYERNGGMGMTPAAYRDGGAGERIAFATSGTALGRVLVAATARGVCFVALGKTDQEVRAAARAEFPDAEWTEPDDTLRAAVDEVTARISGRPPSRDLPLDIRATAFQRKVWDELRRIPLGETVSYAGLARRVGMPKAVRAVAGACARNKVAVVIPCHRVLRSDGTLGGYRWGTARKQGLLHAEGDAD